MYDENEKPKKAKGLRQRPSLIVIEILFIIVAVVATGRYLFGTGNSTPTVATDVPVVSATTLYEQGLEELDAENYEAALDHFSQAIDAAYAPIHYAYFQRGRAYYGLKKYKLAIEDFSSSLELAPECDECEVDYYNRGLSYEQLGDYPTALADYGRAIDARPNYLSAYRKRGALNNYIGNVQAALQDWQRLLKMQEAGIVERRVTAEGIKRDGEIATAGEQTHFVFNATAGNHITLFAASETVDMVLLLRDSAGTPLAFSDDAADETLNARIVRFVVPRDGLYTAVVASYDETQTGDFTFTFTVETPDQISAADFARITPENVAQLTQYAEFERAWKSAITVWSRNGQVMFERNLEKGILRYDTSAKSPQSESIIEYGEFIYRMSVSPNEDFLAIGKDSTIILFNTTNGQRIAVLRELQSSALQFAWNSDSTLLTSASNSGEIYVWNTLDGSVEATLATDTIASQTVAFHPTRPLLAIGGIKGIVEIWDVAQKERVGSYTLPNEAEVSLVAFTPNGDQLLVGDENGVIWILDKTMTFQTVYKEHVQEPLEHLVFSPDGQLVASATKQGKVYLWELASGDTLFVLDAHPRRSLSSVVFRADGRSLATVSNDGWVRFWRVGE